MSNVPDYRNQFLRGQGSKTGVIGSKQLDTGREIEGEFTSWTGIPYAISGAFRTIGSYGWGIPRGGGVDKVSFKASHSWGMNHTANEFRPENTTVKYLIRAQ